MSLESDLRLIESMSLLGLRTSVTSLTPVPEGRPFTDMTTNVLGKCLSGYAGSERPFWLCRYTGKILSSPVGPRSGELERGRLLMVQSSSLIETAPSSIQVQSAEILLDSDQRVRVSGYAVVCGDDSMVAQHHTLAEVYPNQDVHLSHQAPALARRREFGLDQEIRLDPLTGDLWSRRVGPSRLIHGNAVSSPHPVADVLVLGIFGGRRILSHRYLAQEVSRAAPRPDARSPMTYELAREIEIGFQKCLFVIISASSNTRPLFVAWPIQAPENSRPL